MLKWNCVAQFSFSKPYGGRQMYTMDTMVDNSIDAQLVGVAHNIGKNMDDVLSCDLFLL